MQLSPTVCFGSHAACRYFNTWAAAYGQEQPLRLLDVIVVELVQTRDLGLFLKSKILCPAVF
jgi:hypothetical protein